MTIHCSITSVCDERPGCRGRIPHVAYGRTWALDLAAGMTLRVLGHNGAHKTTLIRARTTLVQPTVGRAPANDSTPSSAWKAKPTSANPLCRSCAPTTLDARRWRWVGFSPHLAGDNAVAWSGGSEPGNEVDPAAVTAMTEVGIDITGGESPKPWTEGILQATDVTSPRAAGDGCALYLGRRQKQCRGGDPCDHPP